MKKILLRLALIGLLAFLVLPAIIDAQVPTAQFSECCKLKKNIDFTDFAGTKHTGDTAGMVVGDPELKLCDYTPDTGKTFASSSEWGAICLMNSIAVITDWAFYIFMALTVVFIILGAVTFMAAAGDPTKATKGKKFITYAVIGVVLGLLARALPAIVRGVIGF